MPLDLLTTTADGVFIPDENAQVEGGNIPYISGHLEIPGNDEIGERFQNAQWINVLGRSAHCQVGVNTLVQADKNIEWNPNKGVFECPIDVESLGYSQEEWLEGILENGRYNLGRLIFSEKDLALSVQSVGDALAKRDIMIGGDYKLCEDGSVDIKISPVEFILSQYQIASSKEVRKTILAHGRNALKGIQDMVAIEDGQLIKPGELFIGGIPLSSGKYAVKIEETLEGGLQHLRGGVFLDALRTTGIGSRLGSDAFRQIELYNSERHDFSLDNLWLKVRFYPHSENQKVENFWGDLTEEEKEEIHKNGVSFAKTTRLDKPEVREAIFEEITLDGDGWGKIITIHGDTSIPKERTPKLQQSTAVAAANDSRKRRKEYSSQGIKTFAEKIGSVKDGGRVLVSHELPGTTEDLDALVRSGVRTFIFKSIEDREKKEFSDQNVYMNPDLHEKMWKLSRDGVSFYFELDGENGVELREFYKGVWIKEEDKRRFDKVDTIINMYGWHKDVIEDLAEEDVREHFKKLIEIYGKENLAVAHGKGPGFMKVADKVARELGIFSIGVGMDLEKVDQKANLAPDAIVDFPSSARDYRQKLLDKFVFSAIFNIGGDGTHEESAITTCSMKLLEYLPAPMIYVDICDGEEHIWTAEKQLQEELSALKKRKIKGMNLETDTYPLAKTWVPNIKHYVKSYEEASEILIAFKKDPAAYWEKAGISKGEIETALKGNRKLAKEFERPIPEYLENAAEEYAQAA